MLKFSLTRKKNKTYQQGLKPPKGAFLLGFKQESRARPGPGQARARPGHRSGPVASTESGTTAARSVSKIGYRNASGEIPISHLVPKSPKRVQKPAKSAEIRPPPIISQPLIASPKGFQGTPHSYQHMLGPMYPMAQLAKQTRQCD